MDFLLPIQLPKATEFIYHQQKILSIGSCFTEHIGNALSELKFNVLQNPNGILFDPASVCNSIVSYIQNKQYSKDDLFQLNEVWQSWQFHSRFSGVDADEVIKNMNESGAHANKFLKDADWLIITLGSSFSYRLVDQHMQPVANCHRAPQQWFQKYLMPITETVEKLDNAIHQLFHFNRKINIIFTISPVRHVRDGVMENNRSKARLIEAVHHLVQKFDRLFYFPSYELVIDVLRDYRFYDLDMVHPNYQATDFVLQKFMETFMNNETLELAGEIKKLGISARHKPTHPTTLAHKNFLRANLKKLEAISAQHPYLDFEKEHAYFSA
jgi:hypothetical protein